MAFRLETVYWDIEARTEKLASGLTHAERRLQRFAGLIKAHPVAALGALAATAALVGLQATKMAAEFDKAMRRVTALLPDAEKKLGALKDRVLELSTRLPFAAQELAGALRTVVEVGGRQMREPVEAMRRLELVTEGALATGEDLATVTRTLDDVMDAFGLSSEQAARQVLDLMAKAGQSGVVFGDFAEVLTRVGPGAAAAGVPLDRLVAMVVALGNMGVQTRDQTALLRQAFGALGEESDELKGRARDLRISIEEVNGEWVMGRRGAEEFRQALNEVSRSAGTVEAAATHALQGASAQMQMHKNVVNSALTRIGESVIKGVSGWLMYWRAVHGRDPLTGQPLTPAELRQDPRTAWVRRAFERGRIPSFEMRREIEVSATRPGPPSPGAAGRGAGEQQRLIEQMNAQLDRLTTSTIEEARRAVERLAADFETAFRGRLPAAAQEGLARLRANLQLTQDVQNYTDAVREAEAEVELLVAKQQVGGKEWQVQTGQLEELRHSLSRYVANLAAGSEQHQQARALLEQLEQLQQRMVDLKREEGTASKELAETDKDRVARLQAQARNIEAAARGALQLAQAFGVVDEETTRALENIAQIAANLPAALTGNLGSIVSVLGGLADLIGGLGGPSPEERRRVEVLQQNSAAIERLTQQLGEFGLQITGTQFAGVRTAVERRLASAQLALGGRRPGFDPSQLPRLPEELAKLHLTMEDLRQVARELGITFAGANPNLRELQQLLDAIAHTELTRFAKTFAGQLEALRAEFDLFDLDDPIAQLSRLRDVLGDPKFGSPALREALAGLDLATAEGRAEAERRIQALFRAMQTGKLPEAQLGGLTAEQFLQALLDLERTVDAANQGAGGTTTTFGINRSITEVTGSRIASILGTDVFWGEQTAHNTERIAQILDAMTVRGSVQPPTVAEMERFARADRILIQVGPIHVSGPMSAAEAHDVGRGVGAAAAEEIDRLLGERHRVRAKAQGVATLN